MWLFLQNAVFFLFKQKAKKGLLEHMDHIMVHFLIVESPYTVVYNDNSVQNSQVDAEDSLLRSI